MKTRVHILNQYLWPDCAPTSLYAEQMGLCFQKNGCDVRMICGSGSYRVGTRVRPDLEFKKLSTYAGKRGGILSTLNEYHAVFKAFERYIREEVSKGDTVLCTSAPPQAMLLIHAIRQKDATGIYRLDDYYPDLLRGFIRYPLAVRAILAGYWNRQLQKWDSVVKTATNLDYNGHNVRVLRNWATLDLGQPRPFQPKTVYYFGNLGYGHCVQHFIDACEELRNEGYAVTLVGDGPKVSKLPSWIKKMQSPDEATLVELHWQAEIHLIAADPQLTGAIFPSKYWNSRATGRKIIASGFAGPMLDELNAVNALTHLPGPEDWLSLVTEEKGK